jgi:alkylation response protein AidB-like acyl-CoA dehydrogenase
VVPFALGRVVLEPTGPVGSMDQTMRLAVAEDAIEPPADVRAVAVALTSALQVGAMQRALDMTVAYTKERVQFGRPIGSFQALKHRMADMLVLLEASRSASWGATAAAAAYLAEPGDARAATLARLAAVAGAYCSDALDHVAAETVQLHGGIAITWEHDAQLVFKRAHALSQLNGQAHRHRAAALGAR